MKMSRLLLFVMAFLAITPTYILAFQTDTAAAANGPCYFTSTNGPVTGTSGCAVSGLGAYGTNDIFTGRDGNGNGQAMPASAVGNKQQFINYIVNRYNGSNVHNKVGAAFVIQEMRSSRAWPGNAERDDWITRMNDPAVTFHTQKGRQLSTSSWFDPDKNNVFYDNYSTTRDVVIIKSNGATVLTIERACGNLVAGGIELPDTYELSVKSTVGDGSGNQVLQTERRIGQSITYNHVVKNEGPGGMNGDNLNAYAEWFGGSPARTGVTKNCDDGNGLPDGGTTGNRCDDTFTIPGGAAAGTNYCQRVVASPRSSANNNPIGSNNACVRVTPEWHLGDESSVVTAPIATEYGHEALGGDVFGFKHKVKNNGPHGMGSTDPQLNGANFWVEGRYNTEAWDEVGGTRENNFKRADQGVKEVNTTGTLRADFKAGDRYCQRLRVNHRNGIGNAYSGTVTSAVACIDGRREFTLIPGVTVTPGAGAEAGSNVSVSSVVDNQGPSLSRDNTQWLLARFVLAPGVAIPGTSIGTGAPCAYYANGCATMAQGTGTFQVGNPSLMTAPSSGDDYYAARGFSVPDPVVVGTKYCFALSVKPHVHTNNTDWRYGTPTCITVGIKPKLQVRGHDIKVGDKINTSISRLTGETYGSFGEYGVVSTALNRAMGSGSGLLDGSASANQQDWSRLTFANTTIGGLPQFGSYGGINPFVANQNGVVSLSGPVSFPAASGAYVSPWGANSKLVVKVNGTLTITDDLLYGNGPYASIGEIPRVVIMADDIVIQPNVRQIDTWLVAGRITTCSDANDAGNMFVPANRVSLDANTCNNSLRFNGPVIADQLYPYRTTESGDSTAIAAEIFNLRADAFLSSFAGGGPRVPIASTDLVIDLPPRF